MAKADLFSTTSAVPVSLPPEERARIEADIQAHLDAVDALVLSLDVKDGDADLEPSLGSLDRFGSTYGNPGGDQTGWARGCTDDREDEHDGREPDVDDEPTLGWTSDVNQDRAIATSRQNYDGESEPSLGALGSGYDAESFDQRQWSDGDRKDLEDEHDGREFDVDDEPSLGSIGSSCNADRANQELWAQGGLTDLELDEADKEPNLGWTVSGTLGGLDDREEECEDEGAQCEDEGAI